MAETSAESFRAGCGLKYKMDERVNRLLIRYNTHREIERIGDSEANPWSRIFFSYRAMHLSHSVPAKQEENCENERRRRTSPWLPCDLQRVNRYLHLNTQNKLHIHF